MKKYMLLVCSVFVFMFVMFSQSFAVELTADMASKDSKRTYNGKIYVKDSKCRLERGGTPMYTIIRGDKGLSWQVNGAEKTYIQSKLTPDMKPATIEEKIAGETARKLVGAETVNGYPTKKYEVTAKRGKKTETITQWLSTEYNFPVKVAGSGWSVEYKNIKKGGVSDSIFDLPAGAVEDTMEVPDVLH